MIMQMDAYLKQEQIGTLLSGWGHWVMGIGGGNQGPPNKKIGLTSITFFFAPPGVLLYSFTLFQTFLFR